MRNVGLRNKIFEPVNLRGVYSSGKIRDAVERTASDMGYSVKESEEGDHAYQRKKNHHLFEEGELTTESMVQLDVYGAPRDHQRYMSIFLLNDSNMFFIQPTDAWYVSDNLVSRVAESVKHYVSITEQDLADMDYDNMHRQITEAINK